MSGNTLTIVIGLVIVVGVFLWLTGTIPGLDSPAQEPAVEQTEGHAN